MKSLSISLIVEALKKQRDELFTFKRLPYVERVQEAELRAALKNKLIKIVLGPRRAGKSRLIQKVLEGEKIAYVNFEDEQLKGCSGEVLLEASKEVYPDATIWYFDEIQDFPLWESLLNKLHRRGFNLVVTGSNANLLSSELATALTGRHIPIELFPFSYMEFLRASDKEKGWESFDLYLKSGGYPEVVTSGIDINAANYLSALFDSIVLKDIVKRKRIRNSSQLVNVVSLLTSNVTSRTSARAISKALNNLPSSTTVEKYLNYFEEAYLCESTKAYSSRQKEVLQSERKPYLIDTGLITALSKQVLPMTGKQLENAVYLQLRRMGYKNRLSLYHYRSKDGREIDFLTRDGHITSRLVQVCFDMSALDTRERETRSLSAAMQEHPQAQATIITANQFGSFTTEKDKKIEMVPAYEFCL